MYPRCEAVYGGPNKRRRWGGECGRRLGHKGDHITCSILVVQPDGELVSDNWFRFSETASQAAEIDDLTPARILSNGPTERSDEEIEAIIQEGG